MGAFTLSPIGTRWSRGGQHSRWRVVDAAASGATVGLARLRRRAENSEPHDTVAAGWFASEPAPRVRTDAVGHLCCLGIFFAYTRLSSPGASMSDAGRTAACEGLAHVRQSDFVVALYEQETPAGRVRGDDGRTVSSMTSPPAPWCHTPHSSDQLAHPGVSGPAEPPNAAASEAVHDVLAGHPALLSDHIGTLGHACRNRCKLQSRPIAPALSPQTATLLGLGKKARAANRSSATLVKPWCQASMVRPSLIV